MKPMHRLFSNAAMTLLAKRAQISSFHKEIVVLESGVGISKGQLALLTLFLNKDDIIRVGGRLGNSKFKNDKKHPILLPGNHIFTKRLFLEQHRRLLYAGPQLLLASIREQFSLKGRNLARQTVKSCSRCFRASLKLLQPIISLERK